MWLFLIHAAVFVIMWIMFAIPYRQYNKKRNGDWDAASMAFLVIVVFTTFIFAAHCFYLIIEQANPEKQLLSMQTKREAIVYELENGILAGDTLVDFNKSLAEAKWSNANPWFDWYVNDIVDQVDLIPTGE